MLERRARIKVEYFMSGQGKHTQVKLRQEHKKHCTVGKKHCLVGEMRIPDHVRFKRVTKKRMRGGEGTGDGVKTLPEVSKIFVLITDHSFC